MKCKLSAALLSAACANAAIAANTNTTNEILPDVVVTATRTAQSADASLASVTVITRQDIDHKQAQSLVDVLRGVTGLTIANNGGAGKMTSVFLRGTNADHVLVLIDGIKIGSATLGTAAFQDIPVSQIERIEIVRGPRASLYGSEAIGGVIQIFTRKGGGAPAAAARVTLGSYGTQNANVALSGGGERGWLSAVLDQQRTTGFNACRGPGGCNVIEPDKDGYHNTSLGLHGGYRFDNGVTADAEALRANSKNSFDGNPNQSDGVQQVLGGSLKFAPWQAWNMTLRAGSAQDNLNNFLNGVFRSRFNTQRDSVSWQNDFALNDDQLLTAGLDYQNDRVNSTTIYTRAARSNKALFGQYQRSFGAHGVQASVRRDINQQFGGRNTGGLGYGYAVTSTTRLTVSYGTAFKAPTFNQLYFPGFGNAALRPELARSVEVGVTHHDASTKWSLHAYQTSMSNLIGFDAMFNPVNINKARINGLEGQLNMQLAGWNFNGTLTLQDPRQNSGVNQGKLLNRRATEAMRVEVARDFGVYRLATALYAEGRRFDDLANSSTKRLGGYGLLDVRAEYRIAAGWLLHGRIDNLLGKQYETAQFFNQARRGLYFTLNYQPVNKAL